MSDDLDYVPLVNEEGQHCVWPEQKAVPPGWRVAGPVGSRREVLTWIESHWHDLTPVSLRATR